MRVFCSAVSLYLAAVSSATCGWALSIREPSSKLVGRREILSRSALVAGGFLSSSVASQPAPAVASDVPPTFFSYKVLPDASANLAPTLDPIMPTDLNKALALVGADSKGGALWLGEHHSSAVDHKLQAEFVRNIHEVRRNVFGRNAPPMAIGLEQIQVQFQPALDAYVSGRITADEMKRRVDWEKRWSWSFEGYLPIFETAQKLRIPLIALNVDSEDLGLVEAGGFPNLPRDRMKKYITDPSGFAEFARKRSYKTYVDYVVSPSYDMHKDLGILRTTITGQRLEEDMPFTRFFSGRILWDEGMASAAHTWTEENPGGLLIGLVGADHVKFEDGITGRYRRMVKGERENISVILNPSLIDTRPSGSVSMAANDASGADQITLQLRYLKEGVDPDSPEIRLPESTGGVLALADYIVMSSSQAVATSS